MGAVAADRNAAGCSLGAPVGMTRLRDHIPAELRQLPQWVGWRWEERDGKRTKPPVTADGSRPASCDDPATWSRFEAVCAGIEAGKLTGAGFQVRAGQPYTGIDLDHCREPDTGAMAPSARELIERFNSYSEVSPSGTGVHIFIRGTKPGSRCRQGHVEIYDRSRYLTVTGNHIVGTPTTIEDRQDELDALYGELFPEKPNSNGRGATPSLSGHGLTALEVISLASRARNSGKFEALWHGDTSAHGGDDSAADLALCCLLAFYTRDPAIIDQVVRQSALFREKWERADYRERTITAALETVTETYQPRAATGGFGAAPTSQAVAPGEPPRTDLGNAQRLVNAHGERFRYDHTSARWLVWDGQRWRPDADAEIARAAVDVVRDVYQRAWETGDKAAAKHALATQQRSRLEAMIALARSHRPVAVSHDTWDRDPYLLNVRNGTVDLRVGEMHPHRREEMLTQLAPVDFDPTAEAPRWAAFLDEIFAGDAELIGFVQRAVGLTLIGRVLEHVLFVLYGMGANGKTTFLTVLLGVLGDYARQADPELLLAHRDAMHPTGIADLRSARFVSSSEVADGRRFSEATVKALTGGDRRKARYMRQDFFEYDPSDTIWVAVNHRPSVRGTDDGIWRRMRLVPFTVGIPAERQDPHLTEKLLAEAPGILAWAVRGCVAYQLNGLGSPRAVETATAAYRAEQDVLGAFLDDRCCVGSGLTVGASDLYRAYTDWAIAGREPVVTQTRFGIQLTERGIARGEQRTPRRVVYHGLSLADNASPPAAAETLETVGDRPRVSSSARPRMGDRRANSLQRSPRIQNGLGTVSTVPELVAMPE